MAEVFAKDDRGRTYALPEESAAEAFASGDLRPETPEEAQARAKKEKYDTTGQQIITGAEAAASALTLGGSTALEVAAGVPTEDIKGRAEENPVSHMVGTGIGVAAPLIATGGGSAVAQGVKGAASLTAPALISKAGQAATGLVRSAIPKGAGMAGRVLGEAAAAGAGGAVEGAAYGVGQTVHEAALGDPNLTAQSALSEIGLSAALGGGLGLGGGVLSGLAKEVKAGDLGAKLADWLGDFESERNIKAAGAIQSDITRTGKQIGREKLNALGREMGELGLVSPFSSPAQTLERAESLMTKAGGEMKELLRAADALPTKVAPEIKTIIGKARSEILEPLAKNPLQKEAANRFADVLEGYEKKFAQEALSFEGAHAMRREISDALYGLRGNMDPFATSYKEGLHGLRGLVSDSINAGLDASGASSAAWKQANRLYEVAAKAQGFAEKGVARSQGNNLVSPMEALGLVAGGIGGGLGTGAISGLATAAARRYGSSVLGAAARTARTALEGKVGAELAAKTAGAMAAEQKAGVDVVTRMATTAQETAGALANLQQANQAVANRINHATSMLIRGAKSATRVGRSEASAGIPKVFARSSESAASLYERRATRVREMAGNPSVLLDTLTRQVDDIQEHAPDTAQAIQAASARGANFLASKLPQPPSNGPLGPKWVPSQEQVSNFARYYNAVEDPTSILKQAAAGTLTPQAVEAVRTVYPQLFEKMTQSVMEKLTSHRGPVPYQSRLMLSMLLGADLDGSLKPEFIIRNQAALRASVANNGPSSPAGPAKAEKLTIANRSLTPMQRASERGD